MYLFGVIFMLIFSSASVFALEPEEIVEILAQITEVYSEEQKLYNKLTEYDALPEEDWRQIYQQAPDWGMEELEFKKHLLNIKFSQNDRSRLLAFVWMYNHDRADLLHKLPEGGRELVKIVEKSFLIFI